ncbi:hypothetical protein SDC9_123735 [bioreactor metagenome]|uniref:Uncharacterized protein n=1 Tax=bioreactor metagenome TaxID=1076179 RepID=A0A645CIE6_9ZZZZ
MAQVRSGKASAAGTAAALAYGGRVRLVLPVHDVHRPLPGEQLPVPPVAGGHHAVKKVHATGHGLNDVAGGAHTHEIPGLFLGHVGLHRVDDFVHHLRRLSHRKAADGVAVAVELGNFLHMPHPQVRKRGPLIDAKEHLPGIHRVRQGIEPLVLHDAPLQPPGRPFAGRLGVFVRRGVLHAFVKRHRNVAAKVGLNLHGLLRPHENPMPVDVGGKGHALLPDLPQGGQRKHLKPTGIRENRAVPTHEPVQSAHLPHNPVAGPQMQVVGVGKLNLAADFPQVQGADAALDGTLRAHVHKHRGLDLATVGTGKHAAPRPALIRNHFKHEWLLIPEILRGKTPPD